MFFVLVKLRCFNCREDFDGDKKRFTILEGHVFCEDCVARQSAVPQPGAAT